MTNPRRTPTPPRGLSAEARALWRKIVAEHVFDDAASFALLRQLCEAIDGLRACQRQIRKDGLTTQGSAGQPVAHPLLAAEDRYRRTILAHIRALRITLAAEDY